MVAIEQKLILKCLLSLSDCYCIKIITMEDAVRIEITNALELTFAL